MIFDISSGQTTLCRRHLARSPDQTYMAQAIILEFPIVLASNDSTRSAPTTNRPIGEENGESVKPESGRYWDKRERFHS